MPNKMAERLRWIMDAVSRAGCAGAVGCGLGFVFGGLFGLLLGPYVFGDGKGQLASVWYLIVGSLFLLGSALWIVRQPRRC